MAAAATTEMLSTAAACVYVGVSRVTFLKLVRRHRVRRFVSGQRLLRGRSVPAVVRYRKADLDRLIAACSRQLR